MAERYGEVPKRFSKEWWPHFWMYYKWRTIGTLFALLLVVVTAVQCANKETYDTTVNYVGSGFILQEAVDSLEAEFEDMVEDTDGNGKKNVFFNQINLGNDETNPELKYALLMKHEMQLLESASHLYIYDKEQAEVILSREDSDEIYAPLNDWYCGELDDSAVIKSVNGTPFAIKIENSDFIERLGINTQGLYMAIRVCNEADEINASSYRSAVAIAEAIME